MQTLLLDSTLTALFNFLTLAGVFLCLIVMQLTGHYQEDRGDPPVLQWAHRAVIAGLALTFLWMFMYGRERDWTPWPPMFAMVFLIDLSLIVRAMILRLARINLEPRQQKMPPSAATSRR